MSATELSAELEIAGGFARKVRKGRGVGRDSVARKIKVANKTPEAVFKIGKKYAKSPASVKNMVDYISRDGDLELTDQDGNKLQADDERDVLLQDWKQGVKDRKNARHAAHMMVSTPKGSNPKRVHEAAEKWGKVNLADYNYVFVVHTDEPHPHAHFIVSRKRDGAKLQWGPKEAREMKNSWAEIGSEFGIPMVSSSRLERGKTRKPLRQQDIHIRKRDGYTKSDLKAAEEVLSEASGETANPWNEEIQMRLTEERAEYEQIAKALDTLSKSSPDRRAELELTAKLVKRQAMALRQVKTRRQIMREIVENENIPTITRESAPSALAEAYGKGDSYQKQVAQPAKDATVRAEIEKVRKSLIGTGLEQTKAGRTISRGAEKDKDRDVERD